MKKCEERTPNFYVPSGCVDCSSKNYCVTYDIYLSAKTQEFISAIKEANELVDELLKLQRS